MYVIGLTGGVGSGKTEAAHRLAEIAGAEILIADELGHLVMEKGTAGYCQIVKEFGTGILDAAGAVSRERLAGIVFSDEKALQRLNQIVHPAVKEYLAAYIAERREQAGYLVLETALMFETGCDVLCDEVWYVYVPAKVRAARLARDRSYTEEKSLAIMEKQLGEEEFRRRCRREVCNSGSLAELEAELTKLFLELDRPSVT